MVGLKKTAVAFLKDNYLIISILGLGLLIRLWGVANDLPMISTVADESLMIFPSIGMLARHSFIPEATLGTYFPFLHYVYIVAFLPHIFWLFIVNGFSFLAVEKSIIFDLSGLTLMARLSSILMGTATIWLIYAISLKIFKRQLPAYLAALFFALDPLNVALSHVARVWGPQTFFIYLSLYFSLRYFGDQDQKVKVRGYLITAIFILLSIGVNPPGIFAYFLWLIIIAVYRFNLDWKKYFKFLFSKPSIFFHGILLLGGAAILSLASGSLILLYKDAYSVFFDAGSSAVISGHTVTRSVLPLWQKILLSFNTFWQYESVAIILFIPALFLIFRKDKKLFFFLSLSFLVFFICLNPPLINFVRARYLATMMPFIVLPAAWLSAEIFLRLKNKNFLLALIFIGLIAAPALFLDLRNDYLLARSSSNLDLYYWLKDNLKADERAFIFGNYLSQDLLPSRELLAQIKKSAPDYYSARFKYLSDNKSGDWAGYNLYSEGFLCRFSPEQIKQLKFKYLIISENSDLEINLAEFKICGLIPVDLFNSNPVFIRDTAPFYKYSLTDSYYIDGNLFAESYKPLLSIKQFGPRIRVYQINQ
ncbi:MAG: phospholipid carrier-dependent glycosyltransferase [Patescibacteria group bacterium]|jgi:hypothetical protein